MSSRGAPPLSRPGVDGEISADQTEGTLAPKYVFSIQIDPPASTSESQSSQNQTILQPTLFYLQDSARKLFTLFLKM